MGYRGTKIPSVGFGGGLHTNNPITEGEDNEAQDLSNIVLNHNGLGFRTRYCNTAFNSTAMNSGANVQGLGYLKLSNGNDFLVAICGDKAYSSTSLSGAMVDKTNSQTITGGQDNIWTPVVFNDVQVWFGGPRLAPDAPLVTAGSNFTALGGSPPSAYGAFQANNRIFAFGPSSTIYWSILGNQADWTGVGSGSSDVWTKDGDTLTAGAVLDNSTALLFKNNSIHKMQINTLVNNAFPIFPMFDGVGCAGKHAVVVAYGVCYFITSQGRMRITDGSEIIDDKKLPALSNIDDLWSGCNKSRFPFIQGIHVVGADYDHIVWLASSSSSKTSNDVAFVWDLQNKCWLRHKTGYKANVMALQQNGVLYTGHYNGQIYLQDANTTGTTDASENGINIDSYWSTGWQKKGFTEDIKQPRKAEISFGSQTTGTIVFSWGFDYSINSKSTTIDQTPVGDDWDEGMWDVMEWASDDDYTRSVRITGRGNLFQYRIRNTDFKMKINTIEFSGKSYGQKEVTAR